MKKLLSVFLACSMLVTFAACTSEVPPATNETTAATTTAAPAGDGDETEATTEAEPVGLVPEEGAELTIWAHRPTFATAMAEKFEAEYGIPVTVEEVGFDSISKLMLEGPAGNAADIVWGSHQGLVHLVNAGVILEMDPTIAAEMNEEIATSAMASGTYDGVAYGFPVAMDVTALAYNKDLVETPATTYEEIFAAAADYNNPAENKFYYLNSLGVYAFYPFFSAADSYLFGADGNDNDNAGFDTPEFLQGLYNLQMAAQATPIKAADMTMAGAQFLEQNFKDGNTAYYQVGPWSINSLNESGMNYGVISHPTFGGEEAKPWAGVTHHYVNYYTEYPIAAQLFAQYLTSADAAATLYETDKNITARKDFAEIEGLKDDEILLQFANSFDSAIPQPAVPRMNYIWSITDAAFASLWDGDLTPEQTQEKIIADFNAMVATE